MDNPQPPPVPGQYPADEPGMPAKGEPNAFRCRWCGASRHILNRVVIYCPTCDLITVPTEGKS